MTINEVRDALPVGTSSGWTGTEVEEDRGEAGRAALARRLGLEGCAKHLEKAALKRAKREEAHEVLRGLPYREATPEAIRGTLFRGMWRHPRSRRRLVGWLARDIMRPLGPIVGLWVAGLVVGLIAAMAAYPEGTHNQVPGILTYFLGGGVVGAALPIMVRALRQARRLLRGGDTDRLFGILRYDLRQWEGDLPYGALEAIDQARDMAGLEGFSIHHPVRHREAYALDPVITARHPKAPGLELIVYWWDEGKDYTT